MSVTLICPGFMKMKKYTYFTMHYICQIALVMCAHIITASSSACQQGTEMDAPGFCGHIVVYLDVIFSRGRSKKREQRQFIKVLWFFCVNLFPGSRVWQCCCSRLGHLALRHYKPICLVFMIFAQYFHFVYFFSQEITGYSGKFEGGQ